MAKKKQPPPSQMSDAQQRAVEVSRKVARRSVKETRKAVRRFGGLVMDTTKSLFGVGQRRVNRRNNRTITGRFINDIITLAETSHIAGLQVDLSDILIEPRFLDVPEVINPVAEDDVRQEVFYVVPRMPDLPEITAPYNLPSFRIEGIANGHRRVAILGTSGSGRTTALMAIALWAVREVQFEEKDDPVKRRIEEEIEEMSDKDREKLERKKQERLEAAREQLEIAIQKGDIGKEKAVSAAEAYRLEQEAEENPLPPFDTLVPLYIHLADVNVSVNQFGEEVDPAEPLMRALQRQVSTLTARVVPRMIYERLEENRALILIDGYDELSSADRQRARAWLRAFLEQYGDNFIIMTGPAQGYAALTTLGFAPVFMKPWNKNEIEEAAEKWAAVFPTITGTRRQPGPDITEQQRKRAIANTHGLSPAEITLKIWATFANEEETYPFIDDWVEAFLRSQLPKSYDALLPLMSAAAALQTDKNFITRQGIELLFKQQEATGQMNVNQRALQQLDTDSAADEGSAADEDEPDDEDAAAIERSRQLRTLQFTGLLRQYRGGRYRFRHAIFADYLAGLSLNSLQAQNPAALYELAQKPFWQRPFRFAAAHTDLNNVARMKFMAHSDMLHTELIEMARWLAYAHDIPDWRDELFRRLGNAFVHPQQFITNRERIAAALVTTRDLDATLKVFEYGLGQPDLDVQRLSCLGVGALGSAPQQILDRVADLLGSEDQDVQLAAAHALAAINTPVARQSLLQALEHGEERLQQAVAEELAMMPNYGYMKLYDTINHDEMFVRRAILFGLRRVETEWAYELIHERFLYEEQFFVKLVAMEGFFDREAGLKGPTPPIAAADVEWIRNWADERRFQLMSGQQGNRVLTKSLSDEEELYRALGAIALGQIGVLEATRSLYQRLADPDPMVREAAHKALVEIQLKVGEALPDPM